MTSGNVADEPIVKDAETAHRVLAAFADGFLDHDRGIFMRVDDSVVRRFAGRTFFIRRARGYVPVGDSPAGVGAAGARVRRRGQEHVHADHPRAPRSSASTSAIWKITRPSSSSWRRWKT